MALQKVDRMEAWKAFNKLYAGAPKATEAWIWFLLRSGDPAFVEESAFAIAQHPQSQAVRFALGVFAWDTGRYDRAVATFQQLKDQDLASLHNFAVSLARCHRPPRGVARVRPFAARRGRGPCLGQYRGGPLSRVAGASERYRGDERGGARRARHPRCDDRRGYRGGTYVNELPATNGSARPAT